MKLNKCGLLGLVSAQCGLNFLSAALSVGNAARCVLIFALKSVSNFRILFVVVLFVSIRLSDANISDFLKVFFEGFGKLGFRGIIKLFVL